MKPEETESLFIESLFKDSGLSKDKIEVEKLTGDASTRRYFRVKQENESFVICLDDPTEGDEKYSFEIVQEVFSDECIRVPEINYLDRKKGFIVEEDLGNITLLEELGQARNNEDVKNLYLPVMDELIKIHKINFLDYENAPFSKLKFDTAKLLDETRVTNANFLIKLLGASAEDQSINLVDQSFTSICKFLDKGPWCVTHRDFHSRNIMMKNDKPVVIDFQDARLGIPQYDLVSLLEDCYFFVENEVKEELIEYYKSKTDLSLENFEKNYDFMAIQRLYKAIGSFSYIYNVRGDSRYLKFIGRSFERILSLLSKYDQYMELKLTLAKIYYAS
jgi:aminoglycoside/choline kinase family phosphotransferase